MKRVAYFFARALMLVLAILGAVALFRDTIENGHDFDVFWTAGRHLRYGLPLYSVARDGAMVFKYPPWIGSLFLPLSPLPLATAKSIWATIELFSLFQIGRFCVVRAHVRIEVAFLALISFWGILAVHFLDGQIVAPMLAVSLYFSSSFAISATALSTKIFSLFPLLDITGWPRHGRRKRSFQPLLETAVFWGVLCLPALRAQSVAALLNSWIAAASSSGVAFDSTALRGRLNPSLTGALLKWAGIPAQNTALDWQLAIALALLAAITWHFCARNLETRSKWIGALAIVPVIHPLPWIHLFLFAYPLAACTLDRAWDQKKYLPSGLIGLLLVTLSSEKFLGGLGKILQENSARSFGVLLLLATLVMLPRSPDARDGNHAL